MMTAFERIQNRDTSVEYVETTTMLIESYNRVKLALFLPDQVYDGLVLHRLNLLKINKRIASISMNQKRYTP